MLEPGRSEPLSGSYRNSFRQLDSGGTAFLPFLEIVALVVWRGRVRPDEIADLEVHAGHEAGYA
jgi:hypothetical protein